MTSSALTGRSILSRLPRYVPGRNAREAARELGLSRIVKLASNESPYGPSPRARDAAVRAVSAVHLYPDPAGATLKKRLAEHLGVEPAWITLGNGSVELIDNVARAFLEVGDEAVMARPSFLKFRISTLLAGGVAVEVPTLPDDRADLEGMAAALGSRTRVIYFANPDNPTAQMVDWSRVIRFLDALPRHVLAFVDQAYYEYVQEGAPDLLPLVERGNVLISRTFSKAYGLAGLRIGYGVAHPDVIGIVERVREHFNTNSVAQAAAEASLDDQEFVRSVVQRNARCRSDLATALRELGLRVGPSHTNFLLVRPRDGDGDGAALARACAASGVLIRPLDFNGMPDAVRVTVGTPEENQALLHAMRRALG